MSRIPILLVGGFLGAGKTTLLRAAAERLRARGRTVGLITNDQAPALVDTAVLLQTGADVREIAGSCFCCNFNAFVGAAIALSDRDAILAEPVGSCTDLSATIVQPLKTLHAAQFAAAPLSVLVDPTRLDTIVNAGPDASGLHDDAAYIIRTQVEEADAIVVTKIDRLAESERRRVRSALQALAPDRPIFLVSSTTGEGVDAWLDAMLAAHTRGGTRIAEVDYDRYANGEAVLGSLNAVVHLTHAPDADWSRHAVETLALVRDACRTRGATIGHVKSWTNSDGGTVVASVVSVDDEPRALSSGSLVAKGATMTINARVQTKPRELEDIVRTALDRGRERGITHTISALHVLKPGRPVPTHRATRAS